MRVTDTDPEHPWQWLRLARGAPADPRIILVRALCQCGWLVSGDPPYVLGAAGEHFRAHFAPMQMVLEEDAEAETAVREELS